MCTELLPDDGTQDQPAQTNKVLTKHADSKEVVSSGYDEVN